MDKQTAQYAAEFLLRVQLKGSEVPAFNKVMQALEAIALKEEDEPKRTD